MCELQEHTDLGGGGWRGLYAEFVKVEKLINRITFSNDCKLGVNLKKEELCILLM
jgi:hypothetical protein